MKLQVQTSSEPFLPADPEVFNRLKFNLKTFEE